MKFVDELPAAYRRRDQPPISATRLRALRERPGAVALYGRYPTMAQASYRAAKLKAHAADLATSVRKVAPGRYNLYVYLPAAEASS